MGTQQWWALVSLCCVVSFAPTFTHASSVGIAVIRRGAGDGEGLHAQLRRCGVVAAEGVHLGSIVSEVHCVIDGHAAGWVGSSGPSVVKLPSLAVPLIIRGETTSETSLPTEAKERQVVSGLQWLPDRWTRATSRPHHTAIWQQTLPIDFTTESGTIEQLFSGSGSDVEWMSEARWPNVRLKKGGPASDPGGPLDSSTWAIAASGTDLRMGRIVDPALAATGANWTGGLATLNVG